MHRAEDLGIRVVISDKALRQNNQNTKKALVCSLPALGQSLLETANCYKLHEAVHCTAGRENLELLPHSLNCS